MPKPISSVLVVGEGSAGLLAALALKTRFPELDVRILASTRKPIIGVGESTTGSIPFFLHTNLELEPGRFHRAVCPTWKVGLRFERWGSDATNSFNFAFDKQILRRDRSPASTTRCLLRRTRPGSCAIERIDPPEQEPSLSRFGHRCVSFPSLWIPHRESAFHGFPGDRGARKRNPVSRWRAPGNCHRQFRGHRLCPD